MANEEKGVENIMKIKRVEGFYINFPGDMSVGISDAQWELTGGFYFDDDKELEEFKADLKNTFANYCGENCLIETFDERQLQIDRELESI